VPRPWIAVVGDRVEGHPPHEAIGASVGHAAAALGLDAPEIRWIATPDVGETALDGAAGVWAAPGSPYRSFEGALTGIRWARERKIPFAGTCGGFQHGVIEFARNVLGHHRAAHAEYGEQGDVELFIDELACSLVGQTMTVDLIEPEIVAMYGSPTATERYYCRFGLNPAWRDELQAAGLRVAGVDTSDRDVRLLALAGHPFFVLTLFVPQTSSTPEHPHPLVTAYVRAVTTPP
jgi:CTP synthase (UTP-ammonia lyase)